MKFCNNNNFTLPKQSQRSRSVLQDGSRSLGFFWKEKTLSYNRINTVAKIYKTIGNVPNFHEFTLILEGTVRLETVK